MVKDLTYSAIKKAMLAKGYKFFTGINDLNIIGIRNPDYKPDTYNDTILIAYLDKYGAERLFVMPATTDPGLNYLKNPINPKGCAILKPGQYRGMWARGKHKGRDALVQVKPCTVYRDFNKDNVLDFTGMPEETGIFGIDFHDSGYGDATATIKKASAGCQVPQILHDHVHSMVLVAQQIMSLKVNSFTYTLMEEKDI